MAHSMRSTTLAPTWVVLYRKASWKARALPVPGMEPFLTSQLATYSVRLPPEELQNTTLESRMAELRLRCQWSVVSRQWSVVCVIHRGQEAGGRRQEAGGQGHGQRSM